MMGRIWLSVVSIAILFFLVAPTFFIIPMSFSAGQYLSFPPKGWSLEWFRSFLGSMQWREALWVSFQIAAINVPVSVTLGPIAACGLIKVRKSGVWGKRG